jgi:hypothetical protein
MASAQQKPKATSADKRNPSRRNGKAFGKNTQPKPTGKTVLGYKRRIVEMWASSTHRTFDEQVAVMKEERRRKRQSAAAQRIELRRGTTNSAQLPCRQRCCNPA